MKKRPLILQHSPYTMLYVPDVPHSQAHAWMKLICEWRMYTPLKTAEKIALQAVYKLDSELGPVVIKRQYELGIKGLLALLHMREDQQHRAFRLGTRAINDGLNTPRPLMFAWKRVGFGLETILITHFAEGTNPWQLIEDEKLAPRILGRLGQEIANWHARGLRDRDLKGPNILFDPATSGLQIIDLAGVKEAYPYPSDNLRARDLGRLKSGGLSAGISQEQWQLLFKAYLVQSHINGIGIDSEWFFSCMVENYVKRKFRRNRKHNRPIL